ncbi:MAG: hypothetical protein ACTHY8_09920 [Microbacterium gubbeenense]|uniref:hypothetical protein n=1 Tax=Microbacterium gubbeenense TaxID=159896 RepID=UPI0004010CFB|nr:hypothetical protein [Microbacterium gubbeenense]
MTVSRRARLLSAIGAIALVPAALTACSGGAGGQSAADACKVAQDTFTEVSSDMGGLSSMMSDPEGMKQMIADLDTKIAEGGEKITNEEVKSVYDDFGAGITTISESLDAMADDPTSVDTEALTEASEKLTTAGTDLAEVCG